MAKKLMKLYVWQGVLTDYTDGMIVALAPDTETALALGREESQRVSEEMGRVEPEVIDVGRVDAEPKVWHVWGGG